jgi:hypothetical protein
MGSVRWQILGSGRAGNLHAKTQENELTPKRQGAKVERGLIEIVLNLVLVLELAGITWL